MKSDFTLAWWSRQTWNKLLYQGRASLQYVIIVPEHLRPLLISNRVDKNKSVQVIIYLRDNKRGQEYDSWPRLFRINLMIRQLFTCPVCFG